MLQPRLTCVVAALCAGQCVVRHDEGDGVETSDPGVLRPLAARVHVVQWTVAAGQVGGPRCDVISGKHVVTL